jgi:hypothetical protein
MDAVEAAVQAIGAAYAAVAEIQPRSGVKEIDRLLSNTGIKLEVLLPKWAAYVISTRRELLLALDWTDFDADDHTTLCAYVVTTHGRATPLYWKTVKKSALTDGKRTRLEFALIEEMGRTIAPEVEITLLADRGFGNQKLYELLELLGWRYVIRFRGVIAVEHDGVTKPAEKWLPKSGRATKLAKAKVTAAQTPVGAVVVARARKMKEAWYLATNLGERTASQIVKLYSRRFTIEETFRDQKNLRFGMGLHEIRMRKEGRRDRLLLLLAIAQTLLTLLGAASERSGMDKYLKVNTVKRRTHSLFRQGSYWFRCLPTMRDDWYDRITQAYEEVLDEHATLREILGAI